MKHGLASRYIGDDEKGGALIARVRDSGGRESADELIRIAGGVPWTVAESADLIRLRDMSSTVA